MGRIFLERSLVEILIFRRRDFFYPYLKLQWWPVTFEQLQFIWIRRAHTCMYDLVLSQSLKIFMGNTVLPFHRYQPLSFICYFSSTKLLFSAIFFSRSMIYYACPPSSKKPFKRFMWMNHLLIFVCIPVLTSTVSKELFRCQTPSAVTGIVQQYCT